MLDAAAGFGGFRESGFGREGGKEGLYEYVKRRSRPSPQGGSGAGGVGANSIAQTAKTPASTRLSSQKASETRASARLSLVIPAIDRTAKIFVNGKQARPDGGLSIDIYAPDKTLIGEVGAGNRKDIRNAVEAARAAANGWAKATAHNRAQVIYFLAENLAARADEFAR